MIVLYLSMPNPDIDNEIYLKLVRFCEYQERCKSDVHRKGATIKLARVDIEPYIEQLTKEGFIDELRYAKLFIDSKLRKWGPAKIRQGLSAKGIRDIVYKDYLREVDKDSNQEVLVQLATRKLATLMALVPAERRLKLTRYLLGRGYAMTDVKPVVTKLTVK
jgi:regulatory protein